MEDAATGKHVTKEVFLAALTCPTLGWYIRNTPSTEPSVADQFRMQEGMEIHERARRLYDGGILIRQPNIALAAEQTAALMADPTTQCLFEATSLVEGYATKADILKRVGGGWVLIEVKSNLNDDEDLVDDLAYTAMVLKRSGVEVRSASLLLISPDYRLGMPDTNLLVEIDHTNDVKQRIIEFEADWDVIREAVIGDSRPMPSLLFDCKKCPYFADECLGKGVERQIFDLPRLHATKFHQLQDLGVITIDGIPDDFPLTENQAIVRQAVVSGRPVIQPSLANDLSQIRWPAFYLDFETTKTVIPLYEDVAPHEQIPTQYSVHVFSSPGQIETHHDYLADPTRDCRRELIERLLMDLEGGGSILVYTGFEQRVLNELANRYPDLAVAIHVLIERLVDLEAIIRHGYCHPGFRGMTSIKKVLPVMVPSMSYDGIEIGDGDTASIIFARMARGDYHPAVIAQLRKDLLAYCKLDTFAMVMLHKQLSLHISV